MVRFHPRPPLLIRSIHNHFRVSDRFAVAKRQRADPLCVCNRVEVATATGLCQESGARCCTPVSSTCVRIPRSYARPRRCPATMYLRTRLPWYCSISDSPLSSSSVHHAIRVRMCSRRFASASSSCSYRASVTGASGLPALLRVHQLQRRRADPRRIVNEILDNLQRP